jgi:hypothetical protein
MEILGVCEEEIKAWGVGIGGLEGAFPAFGEHGGVYVGDGYCRGGVIVDSVAVLEEAEGDVACSTGYVEHFPRGGGGFGGGI